MQTALRSARVPRHEQRWLDAALVRAAAGDPSLIVVAGDAGVGKTTLLRGVADTADTTVLFGTSAPADLATPLSSVVEALRFSSENEDVSAAVAPVLEMLTTGASGSPANPLSCQTEIFQSILDLFEQLAERRPIMVVLEDLHVADSSTLDLVTFILSNLRRQRLALMVSYRSEGLVAKHPWRPTLAELVRHPRVDHVEVVPFDRRQVAEQVEYLTGRSPDPTTLDEVVHRTNGNAYFVEELIDHEHGTLRPVTLSLRELLLVKVEGLTESTRRLLRIKALARAETTDVVLAEVAGTSVDAVRAALREAIDHRVLADGPTGLHFRHGLVREALEQDLLAGECREHHAAFARCLAESEWPTGSDRAGHLATLARHWFGAGEIPAGVRASMDAATASERMFAWAEAHEQLERVVRYWDRVDEPEHLTGSPHRDVLARTAAAAFLGGQPERACQLTRSALDEVDVSSEPHLAGMLFERLARYTNDTPDQVRALGHCERAVELVPDTPPTADRARVLAGWASQLMIAGRLGEAHAAATESIALARVTDAHDAENDALNTLGVVTCAIDDDDHGRELMRSALQMARVRFDSRQQMRAHWNLFCGSFDCARWEESLELFEEARVALPRLGQGHLLADLYRYAADVLVRLGRWDDADGLIDEGLSNLPGHRDDLVPIEMLLGRGEFDLAGALIDTRASRNLHVDEEARAWIFVNRADLEASLGHRDEARRAIDEALDMAAGRDFTLSVGYAVAIGLRIEADAADEARKNSACGDEQDATDRARSLIGRIHELIDRPGPAGGWKREVGALARHAEAELSRALGASDPDAWKAAACAWSELDMPYEVARCQFGEAAALLAGRTDRERAASLLVDARAAAVRIGALPLRTQIDALARRARIVCGGPDAEADTLGLTDRELDVLSLLASGATNRGISEALFISVKTAGAHVSSILHKLGVANRAEATSVAFRSGLVS